MTARWFALLVLATSAAHAQSPVAVSTAPLGDVLVAIDYDVAADVVSRNLSVLSPEVTAPVASVHADVGSRVAKGDLLISLAQETARLELAQRRAALARTEAEIELAAARLERSRTLAENSFISTDALAELATTAATLTAQKQADEVAVAIAEKALRDTRLYAPFDGVVVARSAQVGALQAANTPAITVLQLDAPELAAQVANGRVRALEMADSLTFRSDGRDYAVSVARVSPVIDSATRLQQVRLRFDTAAPPIGATGRLRWRSAAEFVPVPYVQRRDGELGLFIRDGERAQFVVLPDAREGQPARVALPADTEVITDGRQRLAAGTAIRVLP